MKYRKALKNYTSAARVDKVENDIKKIILDFGGIGIITDYDDNGWIISLIFKINIDQETRLISIPVDWKKTAGVLKEQKYYKDDYHAYRVSLANVRDWLDAQLAIYATQMYEFPQIFLPYMMMKEGKSVYDTLKDNKFAIS
jgi:hypothetical protein